MTVDEVVARRLDQLHDEITCTSRDLGGLDDRVQRLREFDDDAVAWASGWPRRRGHHG